jgi:hypothetical protein
MRRKFLKFGAMISLSLGEGFLTSLTKSSRAGSHSLFFAGVRARGRLNAFEHRYFTSADKAHHALLLVVRCPLPVWVRGIRTNM